VTSKAKQIALVTGAGRRIGREIARLLAKRGLTVALHCNASRADATALAREIGAGGGNAAVFEADLAEKADLQSLVGRVAEALGPPTCLVNNAALFLYDEASSFDIETWRRQHAVNLLAPLVLARDLARLLPLGESGSVINIVDQRVSRPTPTFFSYGVSKAGLWAATEMLAQALAPRIRVNAIGPGPVLPSIHQATDDFATQQRALPLERGASSADIAAAVGFILDQPAMTGQLLLLDGGQHLSWRTTDALLDVGSPRALGAKGKDAP
jgi:NAD(P)-dependent dehydrogenase (short-subunit alcohol dehydrogenase family)